MDYLIGNRAPCQSLLLDDGCLHAVGLGDLHHGAVGVAGLEEVVQLLGKIGTLAEADAVFLGVEAAGVGQAGVARALADHRSSHERGLR